MNRQLPGLLLILLLAVTAVLCLAGRPAAAQQDNLPPDIIEDLPFFERWLSGAHADLTSPAFSYWNDLEPPLIPKGCAKCHSRTGFEDFLGVDGSAAGQVDRPHPVGTVIDCAACHNEAFTNKTTVMMPSGIELHTAVDETRCTECHQGRQSTVGIDTMIKNAGASLDTVSDALDFARTHNNPGVALKYGTAAKGGYEYAGLAYDSEFAHVPGYRTCTQCHNPYTLTVKVEECQQCHAEVKTTADLVKIRMAGSAVDYNGNGNIDEGISAEITALQAMLYQGIQKYARQVSRHALVHTLDIYPYFFNDLNQNGALEPSEAVYDNRFLAWTPRLLRAAYNYETSLRDAGAYAHNPKYVIQLLYDAIASLNQAIWDPVDMSLLHRNDSGHFAGSEETFRHWDAEGEVPRLCAKCHTAQGLPTFLANGVNISQPPSNGFDCNTCHDDLTTFSLYQVKSVVFPSGAVLDSGYPETNLCMSCHQGRYAIAGLNKLIGDTAPDDALPAMNFVDTHNFSAAATRYGSEAKPAYEYPGKSYKGFNDHGYGYFNKCTDCHRTHAQQVRAHDCVNCHEEIEQGAALRDIRFLPGDFDGDGNDIEGIYYEIETLQQLLYTEMKRYAAETIGRPIVYVPAGYPYFFFDLDGDGAPDRREITAENAYNAWTPRLLRAAFNYQYASGDTGSFAHNSQYIIQTLYDSIEDLGGDVASLLRP